MRITRGLVTIALLGVLAGVAPVAPAAQADTRVANCGAVTVLGSNNDLKDTFSWIACTGQPIGSALFRSTVPAAPHVVWTITAGKKKTACTWKPAEGAVCTGPRPTPAPVGTKVTVSITVSNCSPACLVVASWNERPV